MIRSSHRHLSLLALLTFSLSACNSQNGIKPFKQEFNTYSYSAYVQDNLNKTAKKSPISATRTDQHIPLKAIQRLAANKSRSTTQISQTIQQNKLFTPTKALQSKIDALRLSTNKRPAYEQWLKKQSSLNTVLSIALNNNLDIQRRLQQSKASLAKYDQVSFLDDTLAQYAAFTKDIAVPVGTQKHNRSVADNFPFSSVLALKAAIIDQTVESSRLQLKQTVQDTLIQTRIAYYELQSARKEIGIIKQKIALSQSLKKQLKDSYSTSTITLNSILQLDITLAKNRNQHQLTRNKLSIQQARLNALLNLSPQFSLGKMDEFSPFKVTQKTKTLLTIGQQNRVEIARIQTELKKMEAIIRLSKKRFYPDFSAGYSRFQNQTSQQAGSNANKAAFSTRPRFKKRNFFGTNDAYLNETKIKYKALQAKLDALINTTSEQIQQALLRYNSQKSNHQLYQVTVIPQANITLKSATNLFETGGASYLEVINIQQQILDYRLLSLAAIKGMNIDAAKLSRLIGQSL